jgi:hypothetical protein
MELTEQEQDILQAVNAGSKVYQNQRLKRYQHD